MPKSMIVVAILLGLTLSSIASATQKPAAKVRISFMMKHRSTDQHKDRVSHGRK